MIQFSVIQSMDLFPRWEEILVIALELADEVSIVFPNGEYDPENPLMNGKPEFESLPGWKMGRWQNMKDSSIYFGSLTDSIRQRMVESNQQNPDKNHSYLWHYSLYKNGTELLNVQDFTVCLLDFDTELTAILDKHQIVWQDD